MTASGQPKRGPLILTNPVYVLLFRPADSQEQSSPFIDQAGILRQYQQGAGTLPLQFDRTLVPLLPALWYCLHLPRSRFDSIDVHARGLKSSQRLHLPHTIVLLPVSFSRALIQRLNDGSPKLVIAPDELMPDARRIAAYFDVVADIVPVGGLTASRLQGFWERFHELLRIDRPMYIRANRLMVNPRLRASMIPMHYVLRQMRGGSDDAVPGESELPDQAEIVGYFAYCQAVLSATAELETKGTAPEDAEKLFPDVIERHRRQNQYPVAIGIPGLSARAASAELAQMLSKTGALNPTDGEVEQSVLGLLAAHRALSSNGIALLARPVSGQAFTLLDRLENTWRRPPKPQAIWRLLSQISREVVPVLAPSELNAVLHASQLTCFGEFPIGLVTFPGGTAPLCCRVPISYRPIVPLTRALQLETAPIPLVHWRGSIRVLVAEAAPASDPIGDASRQGWALAREYLTEAPNATCDIVEVQSIADVIRALRRDRYDILVVSAHGVQRGAQTGLQIGTDIFFGNEIDALPPLVCLSACQVSPRGAL